MTLRRLWRDNWLTLAVLGLLVGGYFALRTPASTLDSPEQVAAHLGQGRPMVLYFFSNT